MAVVVICYGGLITGLTNWSQSGCQGLFPAKMIHRGYYDHELAARIVLRQKEKRRNLESSGDGQPSQMIAIGRPTESLYLPCCVQTYRDVTETREMWMLVDHGQFCGVSGLCKRPDSIYIEKPDIWQKGRTDTLTCDLVEYGILTPVCL